MVGTALDRIAADEAGLVALQNMNFQFRFTVTLANGHRVLRVVQRESGAETILGEMPVAADRFHLKIEADGMDYSFFAAESPEQWRLVAENADGRVLSTDRAGGFTGAVIGMYASINGAPSGAFADFDCFEYLGTDSPMG